MSHSIWSWPRMPWSALPLLVALASVAGLAVPRAHAALGACASDPTFVLSDGTELDVNATIQDSSSGVQLVQYTVYVPVGVREVAYIAGSLGAKQKWSVTANQAAHRYETITRVTTTTRGIAVDTTTQAIGLIGAALNAIAGQDDQNLVVRVTI